MMEKLYYVLELVRDSFDNVLRLPRERNRPNYVQNDFDGEVFTSEKEAEEYLSKYAEAGTNYVILPFYRRTAQST